MEPDSQVWHANFGELFGEDEQIILAYGTLARIESDGRTGLYLGQRRASPDQPSPPKEVQPFSYLLREVSPKLGEVSVQCSAEFRYPVDEFRSLVQLPTPLLVEASNGDGFTHLESIELTRRTPTGIICGVSIDVIEDELTLHDVTYHANSKVDGSSLCSLFDKVVSLSSGLVRRKEEHDVPV